LRDEYSLECCVLHRGLLCFGRSLHITVRIELYIFKVVELMLQWNNPSDSLIALEFQLPDQLLIDRNFTSGRFVKQVQWER